MARHWSERQWRTEADFCVEALREAMARHGKPEIFNTDRSLPRTRSGGSQFTSLEFTQVLKDAEVKISMDGRGCWIDNRFIERLWRSLKYECVYLQAFETGSGARQGIGAWIDYYNRERPHSGVDGLTPNEAYGTGCGEEKLAA